ncbi:CvpA family protein [Enterococcus sp. BWB1-3]|uniref:CvpA family protein n=1 Tax=unclassified Enterococcus TaxID=2608891 RepID=UPI001920B7F8|nr:MULTISPECIES: CvpA family protein [unclassified Enterococcus]MBL1228527.1 CvpA family protein [Enterococcus sp. BWB1-3]MCB5955857.1 CvpA family protein [Enterococcus sp. CWB-B31]
MLTLLILFILAVGFYTGAKRGFVLQILYSVGYSISYLVAKSNYKELASHLELYIPYPSASEETKLVLFNQEIVFELDKAFYGAIAFLIILFIGWLIVRFIAIFAHGLTFLPILKQADWIAGGILSTVVLYIGLFLILNALAMIPMDIIQNQFENSGLARFMVNDTPIFSKQIYDLWVKQMIG